MNQKLKGFLCISALLVVGNAFGAVTSGRSYFEGRSQGQALYREASGGWNSCVNTFDADGINGCFKVTPFGGQTFKKDDLAKYVWFNGTNNMVFGPGNGTATATSGVDVANYNFGLHTAFKGDVTAAPKITNAGADIDLYVGLDEWVNGLYFKVHAPINWSRWQVDLTASATSGTSSTTTYIRGVVDDIATGPITVPYVGIDTAFVGDKAYGDVKARTYGNLNGKQNETKLADLTVALGYNFLNKEDYRLGVGLVVAAPTGNETKCLYLFEPMVGAPHWRIGGELSGQATLWDKDDSSFTGYLDARVTHGLKSKMLRSFDLKAAGTGSRYNLVKKFSSSSYNNEIVPAINVTTLECKPQVDAYYEAQLYFQYRHDCWGIGAGYNLWGHSKETIKLADISGTIAASTWGVFNMVYANAGDTGPNATASATTVAGAGVTAADTTNVYLEATEDASAGLDLTSATMPSALTHTVFGTVDYKWCDHDWAPFLGLGGAGEFNGKDNNSASQWSVWATGGLSF